MRRVIAALVVAGLAIAVIVLWPRSGAEDPATVEGTTTSSTSTTGPSTTTTTIGSTLTTTALDDRTVETVEEAEAILRELWFGWFEGIYNQDEERIREVVATEQMLDAARNAFGALEFVSEPGPQGVNFVELELLMATPDCLAVWSVTETDFLNVAESRSGVDVLRYANKAWRFASSWKFRNDRWEADCTAELLPLP